MSERFERSDQQEVLLQSRFVLVRDKTFGSFQDRRCHGPALVIQRQGIAVILDADRLGHGFKGATGVELKVDMGCGLKASAPPGFGTAHALGHSFNSPMFAGEEGDDAVSLTQLLGAQNDRLIAVDRHRPTVPRTTVASLDLPLR